MTSQRGQTTRNQWCLRFSRSTLTIAVALALTAVGTRPAAAEGDATEMFDIAQLDTAAQASHDADGDKVVDGVEGVLAETGADTKVDVVVAVASDDVIAAVEAVVGEDVEEFEATSGFAASLTPDQVAEIAALPGVERIEGDDIVRADNIDATASVGATGTRATEGVTGSRDGSETTYSKNDVVIAVLDSGIDGNHDALDGGKVIGWVDLAVGSPTPVDPYGHGTHVAATAAGAGTNGQHVGMAPGAALVGVRVLGDNGSGTTSSVIAGLDWVVHNKDAYGIDIVNMSLGGAICSGGDDSLSRMANAVVASGITVVVAAGNYGSARCTISAPGEAEDVITVGAVANLEDDGGFTATTFSSRGPTADGRIKPDIAAPGSGITSAHTGTSTGYSSKSGTSTASPMVAGAAALILDAAPGMSPSMLKTALMGTAQDWGRGGDLDGYGSVGRDTTYGAGILDVTAVIRSVKGLPAQSALPTHLRLDGVVAAGQPISIPLPVANADATIGATLTQTDERGALVSSANLDMDLYSGSTKVAQAHSTNPLDVFGFKPPGPGAYSVSLAATSGTGAFVLDLSGPISVPAKPAAPQVSAVNQSGSSVTVSWTPGGGGGAVAYYSVGTGSRLLQSVPASTTTLTLTGLPSGSADSVFVVAHNIGGATDSNGNATAPPAPSSPSAPKPAPSGALPVTVGYSASDYAEMQKALNWMGIDAAELQKTGVYVLKFLVAIGPNAHRREPTAPPTVTGAIQVTSYWQGAEVSTHLGDMGHHYALNSAQTQRAGASLLTFLAAVDRSNHTR